MSDSVRQAIVRIACKSLASNSNDVQCEIDKLKAAKLLPSDFQLTDGDQSPNNNSQQGSLQKCATQLVEDIICKVKQQLQSCDEEPDEGDECQTDVDEREKSNGHCGNSDVGKSNKNKCCDAQQQVLQCSLALLDQQTDAIVRDVERVRQQVADRMVSEVNCGEMNNCSAKQSFTSSRTSVGTRLSRSQSGASAVRRSDAKKSASRNDSIGLVADRTSSKQASITNEKTKKGKQRNSRKMSDKNKSSNAIIDESSELVSDDDEDFEETEEEESESSDDSDEEWSEDEQRNNSARTKKSSRCHLPLNRNCNAATGSECGCGGCGGCSGCGCGNNRVASCNVQDVLDRETLCRALEACDNGKMPVSEVELRKFADEVVDSLYAAVRAKLSTMLDAEYAEAGGSWTFPKDELLAKADEEVRSQVLPVVVDHIVWLMKEERRSLGQLDCDMMMIAFAGQFVDTIVTNAVLKTQVDLSGKRAYTRTFVATSNGGTGSGNATGSGIKSILRASPQKFANDEEIQSIWTRSSNSVARVLVAQDEDEDENASNNCNHLTPLSPTSARSIAGIGATVCDDHLGTTQRLYRRRTDKKRKNQSAENHFYNSNDCGTNNNNNHGDNGDSNLDTAESDYNHCNDAFIREKNRQYSTACVSFYTGCWLSENDDDLEELGWNNHSNFNSNNNFADTFSDDDDRVGDATAVEADDDNNHYAGDVQSYADNTGECNSKRHGVIKNNSLIKHDKITEEEEGVVARNTAKSEQLSSVPVFHEDDIVGVVDEGLHHCLSTTVNHLLSALGSRYLAHRALNSASEWLSRYRVSIDSARFCYGQRYQGSRGRLDQAYVRAGRALLDQVPLGTVCLSTVDQVAHRLFRKAVDGAVHYIEHNPALDLDDAQVSLIDRTRSLWHQAIQTSELLLMKIAIRANFYDFRTPASLMFYCRFDCCH